MITQKQACDYAEIAYNGRNKGQGGYIWGSDGQLCTESMLSEWSRRAPDQANTIQTTGRKWLNKYVWDCSGLFRGMTRELDTYKSGGATTIFKTHCTKTGSISTIPDIPGIAIFKSSATNSNQMAHIGIYIGNGMAIHAKGTKYGVVKEKLSAHPWTHWGMLSYISYDGEEYVEPPKTPLKTLYSAKINTQYDEGLSLWSNTSRTTSLIKVKKGEVVEVLDFSTPSGWAYARYNGKEGYVDSKYLVKQDVSTGSSNDVLYTAKINTKYPEGLSLWDSPDKKKTIISVKKGEYVDILNKPTLKNFAYARYNGKEGYVDLQYLIRV